MKNKCPQCTNFIHVQFEYGNEIKRCGYLKINLVNDVLSCTEFIKIQPKGVHQIEEWQLMEYVQSVKPYIIEEIKKAGFKTDKNIIIRPAEKKDKNDE